MQTQSRKSTSKEMSSRSLRLLFAAVALSGVACGGCRSETPVAAPAKPVVSKPPAKLSVQVAMAGPDDQPQPVPAKSSEYHRRHTPLRKVVAHTTEVFGLRAAPPPAAPKVIRLPPMVVQGTPAQKVKRPPRPPSPPPTTGARLAIEESHNVMADFRLVDVEYVLNGKPLQVERDDFAHTTDVFDGRTRAGVNTLVIRATARGVAKFPFLYLEDLSFVTEEVRTFTASPGDQVTVATIASSDGDLLKPMKDRLHLNIGISVAHNPAPTVGMR